MTKQNDKLLERVAERLAECILLQFPLIKEVEIEVKAVGTCLNACGLHFC